eukprot:15448418-Alexandrium_andersonii.AAC.1
MCLFLFSVAEKPLKASTPPHPPPSGEGGGCRPPRTPTKSLLARPSEVLFQAVRGAEVAPPERELRWAALSRAELL